MLKFFHWYKKDCMGRFVSLRFLFTMCAGCSIPPHHRAHWLTAVAFRCWSLWGRAPYTPTDGANAVTNFCLFSSRSLLTSPMRCYIGTPAILTLKICRLQWNHLSLQQDRPSRQTAESQLCQRITLGGAGTTPNFILDNWLFSLRSQRGLTPYEQGKRQ